MKEENKKNKKRNTNSKPAAKKGQTTKKVNTTKPTPKKKVNNNHKPTNKKHTTAKKVAPKKVNKPVEKKVVEPKKVEKKEEQLEKTLIFDGRQNENLEKVVNNLEKDNVVLKDRVVKRNKVNKIVVLILSLAIVAVIIATTWFVVNEIHIRKVNSETVNSNILEKINQRNSETPNNPVEKSSYPHIQRLSLKEFEDKVKAKEDMVVLIASESCVTCAAFESDVIEPYFAELDESIYEIDVTQYTSEEIKIFRTYYSFQKTPTLFYLKDGIVLNDVVGYLSKEDLRAWLEDAK